MTIQNGGEDIRGTKEGVELAGLDIVNRNEASF